jgi:anthranilate synthase/aminodeoxychorismate synthase-like glutamine amidotransferase
MIVMIDNYDSFTYNLVQAFGALGEDIRVVRNDKITLEELAEMHPDRLVVSPGPGLPGDAGISIEAIRYFASKIPILGVCLGHQAMAGAYGGKIVRAGRLMHGKVSMIHHDGKMIYAGLQQPFEATRYHSLIIEQESLPVCFEVVSETKEGEIMGIRHREYAIEGVQFHPESLLTREGGKLLANFVTDGDR